MPVKLYKKTQQYSVPSSTFGKAFSFIVSSVSSTLFLCGLGLLLFRFISPYLSLASEYSYIRPVASDYYSQLSRIKEGFSFEELGDPTEPLQRRNAPKYFQLSIPKLGIVDAQVETNSESLSPDESIGHLIGSALPGELGEVFLYGHSTSPVFFDSKNYQTIFSKLDKLEEGDLIRLGISGEEYDYRVKASEVLRPEDVHPTFLNSRKRLITLMTCYPFATTKERLLVHAEAL
jgi:LPXTG-site transpeptidase (sortase) family protein